MTAPFALKPTRASRKLNALRFIKRYIAEHGASPSYAEIGAAIGTDRVDAMRLVRALHADGEIRRKPGSVRGIVLAKKPAISEGDALMVLREIGWRINGEMVSRDTHSDLRRLPLLDYPGSAEAENGDERADEA